MIARPLSEHDPVLVVGGGMAGLACAYRLATAGVRVRLIEASGRVGGRVQTRMTTGLPIDDGFQVLFRAYPETRRLMDDIGFDSALLRPYDRGAICFDYGAPFTFSTNPLALARFPLISLADKARLGLLGASLLRTSVADIWRDPDDEPTETYLRHNGFTAGAIERFFRPFFAGILLNPALDTSSKVFRFVLKMLAAGETVTTRDGLGAIPEAIGRAITVRGVQIEYGASVRALLPDTEGMDVRAVEVVHADGREERWEGGAIVVATTAPEARRLLEPLDPAPAQRIPAAGLPCTTVAWRLPRPLYTEKKILLNSDGMAGKRHPETGFHLAAQITNVTDPDGRRDRHLLVGVSVAAACADASYRTDVLPGEILGTLARWFPQANVTSDAQLVDIHHTAYAQFAQPPGTRDRLPTNLTRFPSLVLAGEYTESSSIEGAVVSGTRAAEIVRAALARRV